MYIAALSLLANVFTNILPHNAHPFPPTQHTTRPPQGLTCLIPHPTSSRLISLLRVLALLTLLPRIPLLRRPRPLVLLALDRPLLALDVRRRRFLLVIGFGAAVLAGRTGAGFIFGLGGFGFGGLLGGVGFLKMRRNKVEGDQRTCPYLKWKAG